MDHEDDCHTSHYRNTGNTTPKTMRKTDRTENLTEGWMHLHDSIGENSQNIESAGGLGFENE